MSAVDSNALIHTFYIWPQMGVHLSDQWDELRENFMNLHPMAKAMQLALDAAENHEKKNNDLSGIAHGERDFRNRWRIWYDPDNDRWALQKNSGTEPDPIWDDFLTVRDIDGRVTVHGTGGLDSSIGGFYSPLPRNLAVSSTFVPASTEWVFNHQLNTKPILWDAYNLEDKSINPQTVDVSDPNTAYFYFSTAQAGRAIAVAEAARGEGIRVTDGTHIFDGATRLGFNGEDFYLSNEGHGDPVVNLKPISLASIDTSGFVKTDGSSPFIADQSMGGFKLTNVATPTAGGDAVNKTYADGLRLNTELTGGNHAFTDIDKLVFDAQSFYFDTTSDGQPVVGIRGTLGGGGSSTGNTAASQSFTASTEWTFNHALNTANLVWSAYDDNGYAIIPSRVSVHDPNTAYFYFGVNAMAGNAVVTAAGGATTIDTSAFVRRDGTTSFLGDQSMGGFKLTNVATPTSGNDAANKTYVDSRVSPGFYGIIVQEDSHIFKSDKISFNSGNFYITGDSAGKPVVNLRFNQDIMPIFVEAPIVQNVVFETFAPYRYTVDQVQADLKSGTATIGFYIVSAAARNKNGISITGLDPVSVSNVVSSKIPTGNNTVQVGDLVVMTITSTTSAKHLRVAVTGTRF